MMTKKKSLEGGTIGCYLSGEELERIWNSFEESYKPPKEGYDVVGEFEDYIRILIMRGHDNLTNKKDALKNYDQAIKVLTLWFGKSGICQTDARETEDEKRKEELEEIEAFLGDTVRAWLEIVGYIYGKHRTQVLQDTIDCWNRYFGSKLHEEAREELEKEINRIEIPKPWRFRNM